MLDHGISFSQDEARKLFSSPVKEANILMPNRSLSICSLKVIAKAMKAQLTVESAQNWGALETNFTFALPVSV